jgi:hypothetical protein
MGGTFVEVKFSRGHGGIWTVMTADLGARWHKRAR